jgi:hypothetical protein
VGADYGKRSAFELQFIVFLILIAVFIGATEATEDEPTNALAKTADVIGLFAFSILS